MTKDAAISKVRVARTSLLEPVGFGLDLRTRVGIR